MKNQEQKSAELENIKKERERLETDKKTILDIRKEKKKLKKTKWELLLIKLGLK